MLRKLAAIILAATLSLPVVSAADAAPKKDFKICWSIYVGWMPWGYLSD
ncbi:MAG: lipid kinase, partial [Mesorhizobium sp.]